MFRRKLSRTTDTSWQFFSMSGSFGGYSNSQWNFIYKYICTYTDFLRSGNSMRKSYPRQCLVFLSIYFFTILLCFILIMLQYFLSNCSPLQSFPQIYLLASIFIYLFFSFFFSQTFFPSSTAFYLFVFHNSPIFF